MTRISIYIDGANFLYGLRSINKRYSDFKFDFERFVESIIGKNTLVDAYYYNASLKQNLDPGIFRQQQKLFARLRSIDKFQVVLCKRQRRINNNGDETYVIKGDDIHLAVDMLKDAYENKYDTVVIVSGDGDFAPLVRAVRKKGKKVINYHFVDNRSYDLTKECNYCKIIDKKIANKFFLRNTPTTIADTDSGKKFQSMMKKKSKK